MQEPQRFLAARGRDCECQWWTFASDCGFLEEAVLQQLWLANMAC
tara:strand:+ start:1639 stop:1773 length:135 start_codon:yes stop_codon:yes gene_type:complete